MHIYVLGPGSSPGWKYVVEVIVNSSYPRFRKWFNALSVLAVIGVAGALLWATWPSASTAEEALAGTETLSLPMEEPVICPRRIL